MGLVRLLVVIALLGAGYHFWTQQDKAEAAVVGAGGFVETVMVEGAQRDVVLILAPENCPSEQAQRALALERELGRLGIPHKTGTSFSIALDNPTAEDRERIDRAVEVFQQGAPAVFINGMAKSNPTAAEVKAEYERTRAKRA